VCFDHVSLAVEEIRDKPKPPGPARDGSMEARVQAEKALGKEKRFR